MAVSASRLQGWFEAEPGSTRSSSAPGDLNTNAAFPARCTRCICTDTPAAAAAVLGAGDIAGTAGGDNAGRVHIAMLVIGQNKFKSQG